MDSPFAYHTAGTDPPLFTQFSYTLELEGLPLLEILLIIVILLLVVVIVLIVICLVLKCRKPPEQQSQEEEEEPVDLEAHGGPPRPTRRTLSALLALRRHERQGLLNEFDRGEDELLDDDSGDMLQMNSVRMKMMRGSSARSSSSDSGVELSWGKFESPGSSAEKRSLSSRSNELTETAGSKERSDSPGPLRPSSGNRKTPPLTSTEEESKVPLLPAPPDPPTETPPLKSSASALPAPRPAPLEPTVDPPPAQNPPTQSTTPPEQPPPPATAPVAFAPISSALAAARRGEPVAVVNPGYFAVDNLSNELAVSSPDPLSTTGDVPILPRLFATGSASALPPPVVPAKAVAVPKHESRVDLSLLDTVVKAKSSDSDSTSTGSGTGSNAGSGSQEHSTSSSSSGKIEPIPGTQNLIIKPDELELIGEIGRGAYGVVWKGRWRTIPVAVKRCKGMGPDRMNSFIAEAELLAKKVRPHPNITLFLGVCSKPDPSIVMEWMEGGSLDKWVYDHKKIISKRRMFRLIHGIARGVYHLHSENILHRDLACRNILLTKDATPKLSDFGLARVLEAAMHVTRSDIGPARFMAPESIKSKLYSKASDIWSLAIVFVEILSRQLPHAKLHIIDAALKIRDEGLTPTIPSWVPLWLRTLMRQMWAINPEERPTIAEVVAILEQNVV